MYAESDDGVDWRRDGRVCIDLVGTERNIARPSVVRDVDGYRMWYWYDAGEGYRIGYAESDDGLRWTRLDDRAGIAPSSSGWDSAAQAYPFVFARRRPLHALQRKPVWPDRIRPRRRGAIVIAASLLPQRRGGRGWNR